MPVTSAGAGTPTVSVQVPIPTPVQPASKPKKPKPQPVVQPTPQSSQRASSGAVPTGPAPVSFGGTLPHQHPSNLSAVVLPWSPPPQGAVQMSRKGPRKYMRPGETTPEGGKFEPDQEPPDLGEFIANQFKDTYGQPDRGISYSTGFLLPSGHGVPMGPGERYDDHRQAIPSSEAMKRWGWPAEVIKANDEGTRTPALFELMRRAQAVRVHANRGSLVLHFAHPPTQSQLRAITQHVQEYRPDSVIVAHNRVEGEQELNNPRPHEVVKAITEVTSGRKPDDRMDKERREHVLNDPQWYKTWIRWGGDPDEGDPINDGFIAKHRDAIDRAMGNEPEQMSRRPFLPKKVVRYSADSHTLPALFRAAREDPYDETRHGVIADAIEEQYPGSPFPELIRQQFGLGNHAEHGPKNNLWYEPVENSWDGTFPYAAHLGTHGPFDVYLRHEGNPQQNPRWVVHAVARMNRNRALNDFGYTFEIPHEQAHVIPQMFPAAKAHIRANDYNVEPHHNPVGYRNEEARAFDDRMDQQENQ